MLVYKQRYSRRWTPSLWRSSRRYETLSHPILSSRRRGMGRCHSTRFCDPRTVLLVDTNSVRRLCFSSRRFQKMILNHFCKSRCLEGASGYILPEKKNIRLNLNKYYFIKTLLKLNLKKTLQPLDMDSFYWLDQKAIESHPAVAPGSERSLPPNSHQVSLFASRSKRLGP